jgi:hypothetical protein
MIARNFFWKYIVFHFLLIAEKINKPRNLIEAVTLLTCIREVLGSNLGWDKNHPNLGCSVAFDSQFS